MGLDSRGSSPLGQRRSQAPPGLDSLRLLQVPFALMILGKQKSSRFSRKLFAGAADETEFEPEAPASVTCFSMNFTRWSSEKYPVYLPAPYYGRVQQTGTFKLVFANNL